MDTKSWDENDTNDTNDTNGSLQVLAGSLHFDCILKLNCVSYEFD